MAEDLSVYQNAMVIDEETGKAMQKTGLFGVVSSVSLLSGVVATGRGSDKTVTGYKTLTFEVYGTATGFNLTIEGKSVSGTPYSLQIMNLSSMSLSSNIGSPGIYQIDVTGLSSVNANLTSVTGGNVTVSGRLVS